MCGKEVRIEGGKRKTPKEEEEMLCPHCRMRFEIKTKNGPSNKKA
jgi:hypothetical protein